MAAMVDMVATADMAATADMVDMVDMEDMVAMEVMEVMVDIVLTPIHTMDTATERDQLCQQLPH